MRISIIFSLTLLLASCQSIQKISNDYKTVRIQKQDIYQYPIIAELDIGSTKIQGTAKSLYPKQPIEEIKKIAIANALEKVNGDVIIEPTFKIIEEGENITITVSGYYGTYKNFKKVTKEDIQLINSLK